MLEDHGWIIHRIWSADWFQRPREQRARVTRVKAGENKDKTLTNHHVVTGLTRIGPWSGKATSIRLADIALSPDEGCAVLPAVEAGEIHVSRYDSYLRIREELDEPEY